MRHRKKQSKLNRTAAHRQAMFRNMAASLFRHERIVTSVAKAKALRPIVEKLISLSREKTLHNYRRALSQLQDEEMVAKLFAEIGPMFRDRPGGYTRILKLDQRNMGDKSERALIELVERTADHAVADSTAEAAAE
tara:strand:+ start:440 stop:847 length:408 start_codon:yes stop_codon:yes gene_type:complete